MDYEHGHTPQSYTLDFDAIVAGIRRIADPNKTIAFVGMSLPNIDSEATTVAWAEYASRAVHFHPNGGQFDFVWHPARTPHVGPQHVW